MVNYAVTDVVTVVGDLASVAAALETAVEAVANDKTIRLLTILPHGGGGTRFRGVLIHDA